MVRPVIRADIDFCEWQGRLVINYPWGNQPSVAHLDEALHDGSLCGIVGGVG